MSDYLLMSVTGGGVTGAYAFPHFRNFFALFPQIQTQKLTISAFHWACEQGPPASILNTTQSTKTIFFVFCMCRLHANSFVVVKGVLFARKFCFSSCCCGTCLQIFMICTLFVCLSVF